MSTPSPDPTAPTTTAKVPALSIVIVNWNTRDLLLRVLGQLLSAPAPGLSLEVLVVDNQSSDDSVEAARRAFPAAIVLPQPRNGGFAYGVNRGLLAARAGLVLLLNTDTDVSLAALAAFVAEAAQHPEAGILGPRIVDEHGHVQVSTWNAHRPRHYLLQALGLGRLLPHPPPPGDRPSAVECTSGCVFLIRRQTLQRTGGMDERFFMYYEEADLCARARADGWQVLHLPAQSFVHAGGLSAGQAARRTFLAFRESCLLYHAQWHGRLATEWVRACLLLGCCLRLVAWLLVAATGRRHRAGLYAAAVAMLARPGLVGALCRRPREVPAIP